MECLVFARQLGEIDLPPASATDRSHWSSPQGRRQTVVNHARSKASIGHLMREIERLSERCWDVAGVDRSVPGMRNLLQATDQASLRVQQEELLQLVNGQPHNQPLQLAEPSRQELNLLLDLLHRQRTSILLLEACLFRTESRGGHYRSDAPAPLPQWRRHSRQVRGMPIHTRQVSE